MNDQQAAALPWHDSIGVPMELERVPLSDSLDFLYDRIMRLEQVNASLMHRMMALDPSIAMLPCLACGESPRDIHDTGTPHPEHPSTNGFEYACNCYDGDTQTLYTDSGIGFTEAWNAVTREWLKGVLQGQREDASENREDSQE